MHATQRERSVWLTFAGSGFGNHTVSLTTWGIEAKIAMAFKPNEMLKNLTARCRWKLPKRRIINCYVVSSVVFASTEIGRQRALSFLETDDYVKSMHKSKASLLSY